MAFRRTFSGPEPVRVNKWLANEGVCSRREAEALIADGMVRIDGERVEDVGRKIAPGQTLELAERGASRLAAQISVVINKPVGYVSAQPEGDQIPAARLVTPANRWSETPTSASSGGRLPALVEGDAKRLARMSLAPLGRLDQDSRGLLLLSEDGVLAKAVIGPDSAMEKEYLVAVRGALNTRKLALLRHGLTLDGRQLKPARVTQEGERLRFILVEGRNRQIRRMCELVELEVTDLQRIRIGPLRLGDLPEGKWRALKPEERAAMLA